MTKIIAFGHFKQSGKSTSCEHIADLIRNRYNNNTSFYGDDILDLEHNSCPVKIYSFADKLKQFCVEVLGLTYEQCHGDDVHKNSLTALRWEDMPGVISNAMLWDKLQSGNWYDEPMPGLIFHEPCLMTAREVMQYFGTGICRKMYQNVWVDACLRQIKNDKCVYALIADCRFISEAKAVKYAGGKTIRFLRRPFPKDNHQSEIELIDYPTDGVVDNREMSLKEKNKAVEDLLKEWKWL